MHNPFRKSYTRFAYVRFYNGNVASITGSAISYRKRPAVVRRRGERHPWPHKPDVCKPGQANGSWGAWPTTVGIGGAADVQQVQQSAVAECSIPPRQGNLFPCFYAVSVLVQVLLMRE